MRMLKPRARHLTVLFALTFCPHLASAQDSSAVVKAVMAGITCQQENVRGLGPRLNCDYRVGRSLHFAILGVGQNDFTITVYRADSEGDYYVSTVGLHDCVIVRPARATRDLVFVALVSPKNGKVYRDWPSCQRAA
jgi:hypothetical protein